MIDAETKRFIQDEIRRAANVILNARTAVTDGSKYTEDIDSLFPGMPTITKRPVSHPFGMASRAPLGTVSVVSRVGDHIGNRMVIGHRDQFRPTDLKDGESVLYSLGLLGAPIGGKRIYARNDKTQIGSGSASSPLVLGDVMIDFASEIITQLEALIDALSTGPIAVTTTPGNPAPTNPILILQLTEIKASIELAKLKYISSPLTNIVSKDNFTERGGLPL